MKRVIRLGDPTSHGGTVVSATDHFNIHGKPVARLGDKVSHAGLKAGASSPRVWGAFGSGEDCLANPAMNGGACARPVVKCPLPGHGTTTIVEGDPDWLIDGIPVALEGHKTSCGASLISTLPNLERGG